MPTREEMNRLAREIVSSYDSRIEGVSQIRRETQSQLRQLDRAHNAMAQQLRADLNQAETARSQEEAQGAQERGQVVAQRKSDVSAQLQELDRAHQGMAQQLRADLNQAETARSQEEARRARERVQVVALRKSDVSAQLQELDRAHNAMAQQLQTDLNQAETARRQDEAQRTRDRAQVVAQRKSDVSAQLHELDRAHNAMAQQLQTDLNQAETARRQDEARRAQERARAERRRRSEVKTWIEEAAAENVRARRQWQELAATMGAKRAGAVAVAEAFPKVAPPPPVVRAVAPATPHTEEEAVERAVVGEVTTELVSLGDRIFTYLANHPDGTRLTELEREFGLGRFQAARVVRHLIDEGKARKQDLLYFAT